MLLPSVALSGLSSHGPKPASPVLHFALSGDAAPWQRTRPIGETGTGVGAGSIHGPAGSQPPMESWSQHPGLLLAADRVTGTTLKVCYTQGHGTPERGFMQGAFPDTLGAALRHPSSAMVYGNIGAAIFVGAVILGAILQRRPASGLMLESALLPPQPAGPPAGQGPAAITLPAKQAQTGRTIIPPEQMPTAEVVWEMLLEGQSVRLRMVAEARSGALALWQHQAAQEPSAWQLQAADTPSYQAQQQGSSNGHGMGMQRRLV